MQPIELLTDEEVWPYDLPVESIKEPPPLVSFSRIIALYHTNSIFQVLVSTFYAPVTAKEKQFKNIPLLQIRNLIASDKLKAITLHLRTITNKNKNREYKAEAFPFACFSGIFSGFGDDKLLKHSGLICVDVDGLDNDLQRVKCIVNSQPETVMSFVSPNGNGLKILYRINHQIHTQEQYYRAISKRLIKLCQLPNKKIDSSCSNVSRACFLCHDPDIYLNLNV